jgi:secreted trypsin-like serine protease
MKTRHLLKFWIVLISLTQILFIAGCGTEEKDEESGESEPATEGISIRTQCFSIVDGVETTRYPSTVLLFQTFGDSFVSRCTGTIVGSNAVITAAHCVSDSGNGNMAMLQEDCSAGTFDFIDAEKVYHHGYTSDYFINAERAGAFNSELISRDLAILKFPEDASYSQSDLLSRDAIVGDAVEIVGFGVEFAPYDARSQQRVAFKDIKKRMGANTLIDYDEFVEEVGLNPLGEGSTAGDPEVFLSILYENAVGDATDAGAYSMTAQGDSGGPLFIDGRLAGVTSSGGGLSDGAGNPVVDVGFFTNLRSTLSQSLINTAIADGANID